MIPKYYPPINPLLVSADSLNKYNNNNDKKIIIKTTTALAKIISNLKNYIIIIVCNF